METDLSNVFYEKYFNLKNRKIIIALKNGKIIHGEIIGFFKNDDQQYSKWHIVKEKDAMMLGIDAFGNLAGEIIAQNEVATITFLEDNVTMKFL